MLPDGHWNINFQNEFIFSILEQRGEGMSEMGEGDKEVQTSNCKIDEPQIWNVQCGK